MPAQQTIATMSPEPMRVLIVDDEAPARARLRVLLEDIQADCSTRVVGEADNGLAALAFLQQEPVDVVLADIHMPRMDGLELAGHLEGLPLPPALIFTTAYDNHAVQAFELNAVDYLLKPVRAERLLAALEKARQRQPGPARQKLEALGQQLRGSGRTHLPCHERGRLLLVPVAEVAYFKADLKYVTARTPEREYVLDETLTHLEEEFPESFIRLHRAVLVARRALAGFERAQEEGDAYGWALLRGLPEKLPVSRRQWSVVREIAKG
ncbi:MAG: LytTR family DNA-binding domain-containing protein [Azovibrio sp.]|uniref:LytR/AlgR family response regulator transcription factor n=1 Tax=Azovibrio sp. TaxID=1872673 RepID=UPI003C73E7FF